MFDHRAVLEAKKAYARLKERVKNTAEKNEKTIGHVIEWAVASGTCFGWGFANHRWGTVPAGDAAALPEVTVMGLPADIGVGVLTLGASVFGFLGKYDSLGVHVATGSTSSFGYRMGAELGSKSHHEPAPRKQVTSGAGRYHDVADERERVAA